MIVMKFGGTSLGSADRITHAANIIKSNIDKKPVVVVSAISGITDQLIELCNNSSNGKILDNIKKIHHDILEKLNLKKSIIEKDFEDLTLTINQIKKNSGNNDKISDSLQSFGEQMSSKIVAAQLNNSGVEAQAFNSWDLGFLTDNEFGNAEPLESTYINLNDNIQKLNVISTIFFYLINCQCQIFKVFFNDGFF